LGGDFPQMFWCCDEVKVLDQICVVGVRFPHEINPVFDHLSNFFVLKAVTDGPPTKTGSPAY
jgi:hypothetical protein